MNKIFPGWETLRRDSRKGVSLIVAMCAAALLLGLSLSLIYSASMPMARANMKIPGERSYQLAKSFGEVLDKQLRSYSSEQEAPTDSFYLYVNRLLDGDYGVFDSAAGVHCSTAESVNSDYGDITVKLRPRPGIADEVTGGRFYAVDSARGVEAAYEKTFAREVFSVEVTAGATGSSYTRAREYCRMAGYEPLFYCDGEAVYWNGKNWYRECSFLTRINIPDTMEILYTYDENAMILKVFRPCD